MMKKTLQGVKALVFRELNMAKAVNGPVFHSAHEGYGVLAEEMDEGHNEAWKADRGLAKLLGAIRSNSPSKIRGITYEVERYATQAAAEYIQTAAMARKLRETIDGGMADV
ncbi:MAG: hypothetical protein IKY91_02095 [Akkermansia sp.]|nr:hypothetical protein [Akkermansia sp.]